MSDLYILDDAHHPVPVDDVIEWAQWFETADRGVALDTVGSYKVSTVFLGLDHNLLHLHRYDENPHLFETMLFPLAGGVGVVVCRYPTWDDALDGHRGTVDAVKGWRVN